ncbi:MAG: hypothetical protein ACI9G1_004590 [Pirellulaceae bacterium]|jgi:hypothetical protein
MPARRLFYWRTKLSNKNSGKSELKELVKIWVKACFRKTLSQNGEEPRIRQALHRPGGESDESRERLN